MGIIKMLLQKSYFHEIRSSLNRKRITVSMQYIPKLTTQLAHRKLLFPFAESSCLSLKLLKKSEQTT